MPSKYIRSKFTLSSLASAKKPRKASGVGKRKAYPDIWWKRDGFLTEEEAFLSRYGETVCRIWSHDDGNPHQDVAKRALKLLSDKALSANASRDAR